MNQEQRIEYFMSEIARLSNQIVDLQDERDSLATQVEALRKVLEYADNKLYILTHNREDVSQRLIGDADKAFKVVRDALSQTATPQQHLAEIRAQAGRVGFVAGANSMKLAFQYGGTYNTEDKANQYADSIRKGE